MAIIPAKPSDITTTTPSDTDSSKNTASAIRSKATATQALITWLQAVIGSVATGENDIVTRLFKNKVSATDTTENYLQSKLIAGTNVTITKNNSSGNETLTFSANSTSAGTTVFLSENVTSGDKIETYYNYSQSRMEARAIKELKGFVADSPYIATAANFRTLINGNYIYIVWQSATTALSCVAGTFDSNYETINWGTIATGAITTPTSNIAICWKNAAKTDIKVVWGDSTTIRATTITVTTNTTLSVGTYSTENTGTAIASATAIEIYLHADNYFSIFIIGSQTLYAGYGTTGNISYTTTTATSVTALHKIVNITGFEFFILYSKSDGVYTQPIRTSTYSIGTSVNIKSLTFNDASMEKINSTNFIFTYCTTTANLAKCYARAVTISSTFPYTLTWGIEKFVATGNATGTADTKSLEIIVPSSSHAIIIGVGLGDANVYPLKINGYVISINGTALTVLKSYCIGERFSATLSANIKYLVNNVLKIGTNIYTIGALSGTTNGVTIGSIKPDSFNLALESGSAGSSISISPTIRR